MQKNTGMITAGRLISTTDLKMARKLRELVTLEQITRGATPRAIRQGLNSISFMHAGEFYELERVQ